MINNSLRIIYLTLISCCCSTAEADYNPQDVITINYSGNVVIPPCTIATPAVTVDFGNILATDLATSDSATEWKEASVKLTDCEGVNELDVTINTTQSSRDYKYIANTGTAEHLGVEGQMILSGGSFPVYDGMTIKDQSAKGQSTVNMDFHFRIHNDGSGAATTGSVMSVITLVLTFK